MDQFSFSLPPSLFEIFTSLASSPFSHSLICDVDFDDNFDRTLEDLKIVHQSLINVEDDAQDFKLVVTIVHRSQIRFPLLYQKETLVV